MIRMSCFGLQVLVFIMSCFALSTSTSQDRCPSDLQLEVVMSEIKQTISKVLDQCQQISEYQPVGKPMYRDCKNASDQGQTTSGIYTIQPDNQQAFQVYCDMETDGGGWTVFQRRMDGSVDFYRNWTDYQQGFGNLSGEFWLGLDKLHRLTSTSTQLRVDMQDFDGNSTYAKFTSFSIGDSASKYNLSVSGYSGTAGDSLDYHNGQKFTTRDQDNDDAISGNCAQSFKGAWWYRRCHHSNLNGLYHGGPHSSYADGVNWYTWKGHYYSLKFTEMKLRE